MNTDSDDDWLGELDKEAAKRSDEKWSISYELRSEGRLMYGCRLSYLKNPAQTSQVDETQGNAQTDREDRGKETVTGPIAPIRPVRAPLPGMPGPSEREPPWIDLQRWKAALWRRARPKVIRCRAHLLGFDPIFPYPVRVSDSMQPDKWLQLEPLGQGPRLAPQAVIDRHRLLTEREGLHFTYYLLSRQVRPQEPELAGQDPLPLDVLTARANLVPMPDMWTLFDSPDRTLPRDGATLIGVIAPHIEAYFGLWVLIGTSSETI